MISREANLRRKAMRVAIPLFVEIDGTNYAAHDWSTTGVGVSGLEQPPQEGEPVQGRLSFPMLESTLLIPVQLIYRGNHGGVAGFEFHDLSPRNRRILRHYIDLSLDGKLGDVDDIVAVASLPAAHNAVEAPLTLQGASEASSGNGRGRAFGAALVGLGVVAAAVGIGWYNLTYHLQGTGFVNGSIARITANHNGRVARLLVQPGARVEPDTPLFVIENPQLRNEIEAMEQHVAELGRQQAQLAGARRQAEGGLLQALRRDWGDRERELANARKLYESGVITQRDMMVVADRAQGLRQDYLRQVAEGATRSQSIGSSDVLNRLRLELAAKKVLLAREEAERMVRAPVRGKVFQVDRQAGEFVSPHDPVVQLEADITPSVLLRVPNDDALQLKMGMPATVYVPSENRKYDATVSAIGLNAASANAPITQEGGLNETLVKIDFDDKRVRMPANSRVNVWIRNPSLPWS